MQFAFGDFVFDTDRRELTSGSCRIPVERQVFDLLEFLIRNRNRVVSKDELLSAIWEGRIVSESTIAVRINAARRAIGDTGEQQRLIRTVARKGFRFIGNVEERTDATSGDTARATSPESSMRGQEITFCRTKDGVNLAVATVGQGLPLIRTSTWLNHLEYDWRSPIRAPLLHFLADRVHLIRYDGRGNGLSDWNVHSISFADFELDLETVVNSLNLRSYALMGNSQGGAIAIAHAARHPDRVTKLVLHGSFSRGRNKRADPEEGEVAQALLAIMRRGWGDEKSAFLRTFSSVFLPGGSPEQIKWFAELQRMATSGENAARLRVACDDIDVVELLPRISAPTLVSHSRYDNMVPFDEGRRIAASIPNARFVVLESENHIPLDTEPAWTKFTQEIDQFLRSE